LATGWPRLDDVCRAFQERYGLRPLLVGKVDRAERLLRELESDALVRAARGGGEVAVVVLEEGRVALLTDDTHLSLPVRGGRGEDACREVLRATFGSADGQVRSLGTAPGSGLRPALEVWLARRGSGAGGAGVSGRLRWLPLEEVLAAAGAGAVPVHFEREPGRVLHGPRRGVEAGRGRRRARPRGAVARGVARRDRGPDPRTRRAPGPLPAGRVPAGACRPRRADPALG